MTPEEIARDAHAFACGCGRFNNPQCSRFRADQEKLIRAYGDERAREATEPLTLALERIWNETEGVPDLSCEIAHMTAGEALGKEAK